MAAGMTRQDFSTYALLKPFLMVFWTVVRMNNISLLVPVLISGSGRNMVSIKALAAARNFFRMTTTSWSLPSGKIF